MAILKVDVHYFFVERFSYIINDPNANFNQIYRIVSLFVLMRYLCCGSNCFRFKYRYL